MSENNVKRGKRFNEARTVLNQHGSQTMLEVANSTGVSASAINALENIDSCRSVGYDKVVALAKHYGVSTDYLLGLSDVPSSNSNLVLSHKAISTIKKMTPEQHAVFDQFLNHPRFIKLLSEIQQKKNIIQAEISYLESRLNHPKLSNPENFYKRIPDKFFYDELIKQYPFLENRLFLATGEGAIKKQSEQIEQLFRRIVNSIVPQDGLRELLDRIDFDDDSKQINYTTEKKSLK